MAGEANRSYHRTLQRPVELIAVDDMIETERQELEQALAESEDDVKAGRVYSAAEVLDELRRQ